MKLDEKIELVKSGQSRPSPHETLGKLWPVIVPFLENITSYLRENQKPTTLDQLKKGESPLINFILERTVDRSEDHLIEVLEEIANLRAESEFWLSGVHSTMMRVHEKG